MDYTAYAVVEWMSHEFLLPYHTFVLIVTRDATIRAWGISVLHKQTYEGALVFSTHIPAVNFVVVVSMQLNVFEGCPFAYAQTWRSTDLHYDHIETRRKMDGVQQKGTKPHQPNLTGKFNVLQENVRSDSF